MTEIRIKPQRRMRHEILSLVPLAVLITALILAFPADIAVGGSARRTMSDPSCIYVELTDVQEREVMKKMSSAISTGVSDVRDLRPDLSISTIPERPAETIVRFEDRRAPAELSKPAFEVFSIPATAAAPDPVEIVPVETPKAEKTFSKEEMLKFID